MALLLTAALSLSTGSAGARDYTETPDQTAAVEGRSAVYALHRSEGPDTLMDIARAHGLGFVELRTANPEVDPWRAGDGRAIVLPSLHLEPSSAYASRARRGIVVNLADMRLYFYRGGGQRVLSYPIGIGREGWETPIGETRIVLKRPHPTWIPPASIRAANPRLPALVPPGPGNPLGDYALNLGWPSYVIHGTNKPDGVGRRVSHGCLRLYPEDIEHLFALVDVGTPVTVVDQPVKLGWLDGALYLEAHPSRRQALEMELLGGFPPEPLPELRFAIESFTAGTDVEVDWQRAALAVRDRRGLPVRISR